MCEANVCRGPGRAHEPDGQHGLDYFNQTPPEIVNNLYSDYVAVLPQGSPLCLEKDSATVLLKFKNVPVHSVISPLGTTVDVLDSCITGTCNCIHSIEGVASQLKPCRFASFILMGDHYWREKYWELLWSITDGFPIVDEDFEGYECGNYDSITTGENKIRMDKIIKNELSEGMISVSDTKPKCIHALGAVPKSNGGIRPITDCSRPVGVSVNSHCSSLLVDFCFKSVDDVVGMLEEGYYMSVVDIKAAYRAVPIIASHRMVQGFKWILDGKEMWFVDNRLCFGLRLGPSYFNLISNFVHEILSKMYNLNVVNYLDDFIVVCPTLEECMEGQRIMVSTLRYLGFHVAFDELFHPSRCVTYLGIEIDSNRMELRLPEGKISKLKALLDFYYSKRRISKKNLESLSGYLSHCSHIVKGGKMFCRNVYDLYKKLVRRNLQYIDISNLVKEDLLWWKNLCSYFNGSSKIVKELYYLPLVSDSSKKGFGAYLGSDWVAGTWRDSDSIPLVSGCQHVAFRPIADVFDIANINELELWPIVVGLKRWAHVLRDKNVLLFTDNTQVMHMLLNSSSSNILCRSWLREVFWLCAIFNIELSPRYINTKCNLVADTLSRLLYFKNFDELAKCLNNCDLCCLNLLFDIYRPSIGDEGSSVSD